jgi:hypothetical protein
MAPPDGLGGSESKTRDPLAWRGQEWYAGIDTLLS